MIKLCGPWRATQGVAQGCAAGGRAEEFGVDGHAVHSDRTPRTGSLRIGSCGRVGRYGHVGGLSSFGPTGGKPPRSNSVESSCVTEPSSLRISVATRPSSRTLESSMPSRVSNQVAWPLAASALRARRVKADRSHGHRSGPERTAGTQGFAGALRRRRRACRPARGLNVAAAGFSGACGGGQELGR
jgi:hypothetical protein